MIEAIGGLGYALWVVLGLAVVAVVVYKTKVEGNPTEDENAVILKSTEDRGNWFWTTDRTESKWGTE